jgi:hypothetical protein
MSSDMRSLVELIPRFVAQGIENPMTPGEVLPLIQARPGYIPMAIIPASHPRVLWGDVGERAFTEWKFRYSVQRLVEGQLVEGVFSTDLGMLGEVPEPTNTMIPSGFIFQMSLCGSTLIARALARSPRCVVLNEPTPVHEPLWEYLSGGWMDEVVPRPEQLRLFRNLVLWMGRARSREHRRLFVKFRSWNTLFIEFIRQAFPEVPCMFVYRLPEEVLVSAMRKEPTGYTRFRYTKAGEYLLQMCRSELDGLTREQYFAALYCRILKEVARHGAAEIRLLDYQSLSRERFGRILRGAFRIELDAVERELMVEQFDYYSKDDSNSREFAGDSRSKQEEVTVAIRKANEGALQSLYDSLRRSEQNLFPPG